MEATDNFFLPPFVGTAVVKILLLFLDTNLCVQKILLSSATFAPAYKRGF